MAIVELNGDRYDTTQMDSKEVVALIINIAAGDRHVEEVGSKDLREMHSVFCRIKTALEGMIADAERRGR